MKAVLDAWAVISVARSQAGSEYVQKAIDQGELVISWITLGEVYYVFARRYGESAARDAIDSANNQLSVELPDVETILDAAQLKAYNKLSYADAFTVVTAQRHRVPVLTGDPEIVALSDQVEVVDLRNLP